MERIGEAELQYYQTLRTCLAAYARGMPVAIALEFGRRSIPPELRPGFGEMEQACRQASGKIVEMPP
jgi:chemotaxis protein MotA